MSSHPTAEVRPAQPPASFPEKTRSPRPGDNLTDAAPRPARCDVHAEAAGAPNPEGAPRVAARSCPDCRRSFPSNRGRTERRRRRRDGRRDLARRAQDPRQMALDCARRILEIAEAEQDKVLRAALFRAARAYQMRGDGDEHQQRMAVLDVLEKCVLVTLDVVVEQTLLPAALIQSFLDEWASAEVDLVFIHTKDGKGKCGRRGTTLYYGLRK